MTEAVECHHWLNCGPLKQFQQLGADVGRTSDSSFFPLYWWPMDKELRISPEIDRYLSFILETRRRWLFLHQPISFSRARKYLFILLPHKDTFFLPLTLNQRSACRQPQSWRHPNHHHTQFPTPRSSSPAGSLLLRWLGQATAHAVAARLLWWYQDISRFNWMITESLNRSTEKGKEGRKEGRKETGF